jgi:hypothetical protein
MNLPDWLKNLLIALVVIALLIGLWAIVKFIVALLFWLALGALVLGGLYLLARKTGLL